MRHRPWSEVLALLCRPISVTVCIAAHNIGLASTLPYPLDANTVDAPDRYCVANTVKVTDVQGPAGLCRHSFKAGVKTNTLRVESLGECECGVFAFYIDLHAEVRTVP